MGNFNQLLVWQKSVDFAASIYRCTRCFPKDEMSGLRLQLRRAAVSIASNLAEGQGRRTRDDYRRFVVQARGSAFEIQTQILICERLRYLDSQSANELRTTIDEIARMLNGLIAYLTPRA
ncbi:MAG TPA: four helix bundle protein [Thermoanaerobaculia bacterium]|nr:four helix bundle protein [Thermoanaerobaculia bacterium]